MGASDLSVQVRNISPKATEEDLITFFSYCGTVEKLQLRRDGDESQLAIVTFKQVYAFRTALLLNDAVIVDRRVSIAPLEKGTSAPIPCAPKNRDPESERSGGFVPATRSTVQAVASIGQKAMTKTKDRASDAGKILTHQAKTAFLSAERTAESIGSASSNCISMGAMWLSDVLGKASKGVAELGNAKARNPNSIKQK